ncbi:GDSL-type esterase/lipase family protein [Sphingobacterium arenae]|nr:GDSL-type esterase/lipase family protein [Sphingobacterium arenae]
MKNYMHKVFYLFVLLLCTSNVWSKTPIRVAAIGDSVTEGLGLQNPDSTAYPAVLQRLLGDAYAVKNFGHSGATLLRRGHNPYAATKQLQDALAFQADIAVIHLGLNDTDPRNFPHYRDQFIADYLWLIDTLQANNPDLKIFICKMSPIFTGHPRFTSSTFDWYHLIQEKITQVAEATQSPLIDFYSELHARPDLFTDKSTLHPNRQGAAQIAKIVQQHITGNFGGLQLPPVFGKYMVVQRDKPFQIWGRANARTTVEVEWNHKSQHVVVGTDGRWELTFPAPTLNRKPQTLRIKNGENELVYDQVLVGDVWLAAGQSNMEFRLRQALGGDSLATRAQQHTAIRLLQFDSYAQTNDASWDTTTLQKANELDFFHGEWTLNNKENALHFSAVAYTFAQEIALSQDIPVGIINLSVGGSPQLAWLPRLSLESDTRFVGSLHPWRTTDYLMRWCRERASKNVSLSPSTFQQHPYAPSYIFEAGIAPLVPFALRGVIWYQGESDAENAELYSKLFPYFVQQWRHQWRDEFSFYYVQLSSMERPSWPYFRDQQRKLLTKIPKTGMAVTSDIGDPKDVHPTEKITVGKRLAQWAIHHEYGLNNIPSGPLLKDFSVDKDHIIIHFDYADGIATADGQAPKGFAFQTRDGRSIHANATIRDEKVYIKRPTNVSVTALVYGWKPVSDGNLINRVELPASTFRIELNNI